MATPRRNVSPPALEDARLRNLPPQNLDAESARTRMSVLVKRILRKHGHGSVSFPVSFEYCLPRLVEWVEAGTLHVN